MAEADPATPFNTRTIAWVIVAGLIAFIGFVWLTAYAPQLKMREGGGASPLSKSAVGFYGFYRLAELTGRPVDLNTDSKNWILPGLTIVTIDPDTDVERLKKLVATRRAAEGAKTLYILPKWLTLPLPARNGWVQTIGKLEPEWSKPLLEVFGRIRFAEKKTPKGDRIGGVPDGEMTGIGMPAPPSLHYIAQGLKPVLVDSEGAVVLGRIDLNNGSADYILADPDILSNQGLKTPQGAHAALAIVDALRKDEADSIAFDMVLNGMANSRNLLQLMFEPPFLALTLVVLAAAILTGLHAFGRFGPTAVEPRAIPFGKRALADNTAILIGRARAEHRLGDRYVTLTRDAAAAALGAFALAPDALEAWLAGLPHRDGADFATLAQAARAAPNAHAMQAAAMNLFEWKKDMTRDR